MPKMQIEVQPWLVPNFVTGKMPAGNRQDGIVEPPKWALSDVEPDVLASMCNAFRAEVFRKAGKPDPAKAS